jgi:FMN-dependent NADH-azoreductase
MKLLQIDASITGEGSVSRQVTAAVVDTLAGSTPGLSVTRRDLSAEPLPHLTLAHMPGDHPVVAATGGASPGFDAERAQSNTVLDEFLAADIVVIGAPMYNFTAPSQLKAWIDRILTPGKTFRYTATGHEGLAGGKRVIVAVSRGNFYGAGAPAAAYEHLETYLRAVLGFIGVTDPEFIIAEGIQLSPDHRERAVSAALKLAAELPAGDRREAATA